MLFIVLSPPDSYQSHNVDIPCRLAIPGVAWVVIVKYTIRPPISGK